MANHFHFDRDTFAFANELVWEYRFDSATGAATTFRRQPPPTYAHHCFVLVRAALQFYRHATFAPSTAPVSDAEYGSLIRKVMARNPRVESSPSKRIVIPGYDCLRAFSVAREEVLKQNCGGAWQSYFLRSHWRMVFPISRSHQERTSSMLTEHLQRNHVTAVHLVRFPQLTINHGMLLYGFESDSAEVRFTAYDPNLPGRPTTLTYRHDSPDASGFFLPANTYWPGGQLDIIEIFRGWLY